MSEPKVIWSGTYAGTTVVVGGGGVVLLDGHRVRAGYIRDNILLHAVAQAVAERDVLLERLTRVELPARQLVDIDNELAEGRDVVAKASFHDAAMRPIEELRVYFGNVARAEKRGQTIFDWEVERRKRAERERDEMREQLAKLEAEKAALPAWIAAHDEYDIRRPLEEKHATQIKRLLDEAAEAERETNELRERLVKLEAGLATACNEWEYASQYKGEFLAKKHGDAEDIAELRELLKGTGDVET